MRKIQWLVLALVCFAFCQGCIAVPWPHKVVTRCHTIGKVVDEKSGKPVSGIKVYLASHPSESVETQEDGSFHLPPHYQWRFFIWLILVPYDVVPSTDYDWLVISENNPYPHYRSEQVQVRASWFAPYRIFGVERRESNLYHFEYLGVIRIKEFKPPVDGFIPPGMSIPW